jgi:hypothetical protein
MRMTGKDSSVEKVFFFSPSQCYMDGELLKLKGNAKPIKAKKTASDWKDRTDIVVIIVQDNIPKLLNKGIITKLEGYETSKD